MSKNNVGQVTGTDGSTSAKEDDRIRARLAQLHDDAVQRVDCKIDGVVLNADASIIPGGPKP